MIEARYLPEFQRAIQKYSNIKKAAQNKIELILENPLGFGEPLKYDLLGLTSCPVKRNFILIYVYCRECRIKNYQSVNSCHDCDQTPDEVVKFITIAPHDLEYKLVQKVSL